MADDTLDPTLRALYEAEASAPLPAGAEERVLSGVLQSIAMGSPPPVVDAAATSTTGTMAVSKAVLLALGTAALGVVAGIAIERETGGSEKVVVAPAAVAMDAGLPTPVIDARPVPVVVIDAAVPDNAVPDKKTKPRPPKQEPVLTPSQQQERKAYAREAHLIDRARVALRRQMYGEALIALMQHERTFKAGQLAEERDVLAIEAYVAQGNHRVAKRRIQQYRNRYPQGFQRGRVGRSEALLKGAQ